MPPQFHGILIRFLSGTLGLCVLTMAGLAVLQVILRYVFASALMWVEEVSVMIMLWMTWLGASLLWLTRGHIAVDLLTTQFSRHIRKALASVTDIIGIVLSGTLLVASLETLTTLAGMELDTLPIELSIKYYPIPVGAIFLGLAAALDFWFWKRDQEPEP